MFIIEKSRFAASFSSRHSLRRMRAHPICALALGQH